MEFVQTLIATELWGMDFINYIKATLRKTFCETNQIDTPDVFNIKRFN